MKKSCEDELWSESKRLLGAATPAVPRENLSRSRGPQRLKGRSSSAPHVSGEDTRGCSDAAFMHASLKLQSRKYAR